VQAEKLPELRRNNEAFQVWLMKDGGNVLNAGTFVSHIGTGAQFFTLGDAHTDYNQIAFTLEPDAYGSLPRGQAVLVAVINVKG
jgi:hypothetical protein